MRYAIVAACLVAAMPMALANGDPVQLGRRLYETGILANGEPVHAVRAGHDESAGALLACAQCHRRSGLGGREGEIAIPPIAQPYLYSRPQPQRMVRKGRTPRPILQLRQDSREAYDDATLARAIRSGVDSLGRPLAALMPRYAIDEANMGNLVAYLRQLGAVAAPGVGPGSLRLATVVTPDADPERRRGVVEALSAWSASGALSKLALPLDVWQLAGEPATWAAQLRERYRRQPVFAVISGAGGANWQPVSEFCEEQAVPCVFPIIDSAPDAPDAYYNLYLDTGLPLEARLLAASLRADRPARLVQLVADAAGAAAAERLRLEFAGLAEVTRRWDAEGSARLLADLREDDVLVAWLRPPALQALLAQLPVPPAHVYVSARLSPPGAVSVPAALQARLRWVSTRIDPRRLRANNAVGLMPWAEQLRLAPGDEALQAEVYAATYFFSDALARMRGRWNRDYLLETLESGMYSRPAGRLFYSLSLGPGQRVAAKAGHLLGLLPPNYEAIGPIGPRLLP